MASSRNWISSSGPRKRSLTTLTFVLSKPTLVEFLLVRVAPDCRSVARFRVKARAGTNRVRFPGRIRGRALRAGTYVIRARTLPARRALAETKLVIFKRRPLPKELAAAQSSNTCRSSNGDTWPGDAAAAVGSNGGKLKGQRGAEGSTPIRVGKEKAPLGVLGARFSRAAEAIREVPAVLFVLLGMAIALLAAAAVPIRLIPNARLAAALAYRRTFVALVGAIALASVALVYTIA